MFTANSNDAPTRLMVTFLIVTCFVAVMVVLVVAVWLRARQVISERRQAVNAKKDAEALAARRSAQLAVELEAQAASAAAVAARHTTRDLLPDARAGSGGGGSQRGSPAGPAAPGFARRVEAARGRHARDQQNPAPRNHGQQGPRHASRHADAAPRAHTGQRGPQPHPVARSKQPMLTTKHILPTSAEPWQASKSQRRRRGR